MKEKKKVTTRDIARECFVSQSAVSMILSEKEGTHFSPETRKLVKETARKLGYEYTPRKTRKVTDMKSVILIMCPSLATQYYTTLVQTITGKAQKMGLCTLTAHTDRSKEREEYYLKMAADNSFYGVIYTYVPKAQKMLNHLDGTMPLVLINDHNPELKMELLELDSKKSGAMIARHLLELGHKKIAYVTTPLSKMELPRRRRLLGMQEEWEKAGLDASFIKVLCEEKEDRALSSGNQYYDTGFRLTRKYFEHPEGITAFAGTNDFVAIGIMDAITSLGFRIPKDYSVCGFDNTLVASFSGISLTSIDHCIGEKGEYAVTMLESQHNSLRLKKNKNKPLIRLEYEPHLIARNSTGPVCKK
ncbi:MAG: LacI family transcriptional regulator [Eubacterium sp.]|nr:LacI family transcriptional regulator [Eubacterium sp.]